MEPRTLNRAIGLTMHLVRATACDDARAALDGMNHAKRLALAGYPAHTVRLAIWRASLPMASALKTARA